MNMYMYALFYMSMINANKKCILADSQLRSSDATTVTLAKKPT